MIRVEYPPLLLLVLSLKQLLEGEGESDESDASSSVWLLHTLPWVRISVCDRNPLTHDSSDCPEVQIE